MLRGGNSTSTLSTASGGEAQCPRVPSNSHFLFILQTADAHLLNALLPHPSLHRALQDPVSAGVGRAAPRPAAPSLGQSPRAVLVRPVALSVVPQVPGAAPALGPQPEVHTPLWRVDRAGKVGRGRYHRREEKGGVLGGPWYTEFGQRLKDL